MNEIMLYECKHELILRFWAIDTNDNEIIWFQCANCNERMGRAERKR